MKRILAASALTIATATSAFAATEAEVTQIQQYVPDADVAAWSDQQVDQALAIINSTESRTEIEAQLMALYGDGMAAAPGAQLTEAEMTMLDQYVEGVDYSTVSQANVDAALAVAASEMSPTDRQTRIQSLLSQDETPMYEGNMATSGQVALIETRAPNVDVSTLTDAQVAAVLNMINSHDENDGDVSNKIEAYLN